MVIIMPSFPFSSGPRGRFSRVLFIIAFVLMMGFIAYVVLKNVFRW